MILFLHKIIKIWYINILNNGELIVGRNKDRKTNVFTKGDNEECGYRR